MCLQEMPWIKCTCGSLLVSRLFKWSVPVKTLTSALIQLEQNKEVITCALTVLCGKDGHFACDLISAVNGRKYLLNVTNMDTLLVAAGEEIRSRPNKQHSVRNSTLVEVELNTSMMVVHLLKIWLNRGGFFCSLGET